MTQNSNFQTYITAVDAHLTTLRGVPSSPEHQRLIQLGYQTEESPADCAARLVRAFRLAALNDVLRQTFYGGRITGTAGVTALGEEAVQAVLQQLQTYDQFNQDNDPYGEHDFGVLEYAGEKLFWKIDYYDLNVQYGSEDPTDPKQTCRVLTLMLANEY